MILLTFAHKNEAQSFIYYFDCSLAKEAPQVWQKNDLLILITGEGQFETLWAVTKVLKKYHKISHVYNLGVSGSLGDRFHHQDIVSIRTSYLALENQAQFKSFPLKTTAPLPLADCLTSSKRIIKKKERLQLSPFADLVDRELWSIGFACHKSSIPLYAIKIISDDQSQEEINICEKIREKAKHYSDQLLKTFLKIDRFQKNDNDITEDNHAHPIFTDKEFHFTRSMKNQFRALSKKLALLHPEGPIGIKEIEEVLSLEKAPKERALLLLKGLVKKLNPLRDHIEVQLSELSRPLEKANWAVKHDPQIEDQWISLSSKVKNQGQLSALIKSLQNFPLEKWQDTFEGKEHD